MASLICRSRRRFFLAWCSSSSICCLEAAFADRLGIRVSPKRERERERERFDFGEWSREKKEKWMRVKRGADEIWLGLVVSGCCLFILNFWVCFFQVDFIIFLGLWVCFVGGFSGGKGFWMNFCMFNFLGNLHFLSRRTWRTCYFVLLKIMKRKKRKKKFNYSF